MTGRMEGMTVAVERMALQEMESPKGAQGLCWKPGSGEQSKAEMPCPLLRSLKPAPDPPAPPAPRFLLSHPSTHPPSSEGVPNCRTKP